MSTGGTTNADNNGDPIEQPGTGEGSGITNGEEGDNESSEVEDVSGDFNSALKKRKKRALQDGSLAPSFKKNSRIKDEMWSKTGLFRSRYTRAPQRVGFRSLGKDTRKGGCYQHQHLSFHEPEIQYVQFCTDLVPGSAFGFAFLSIVPSSEVNNGTPQQGVSIMDELNHTVEFGTAEEVSVALAKVEAVLKCTVHLDIPGPPPPAVAQATSNKSNEGLVTESLNKAPQISAQVVEHTPLDSKSKRKSLEDSEGPPSSSDSSDAEEPRKKPKKHSRSTHSSISHGGGISTVEL
ncbi:uncharacterized protein MELLADRAFT_69077 [Melampsora larici-populina 98AG31]|uniref:Uncharacterized protein n=1 Tax=Melampsora larici-populina (strain 98AG31 / pathotype 3-4-7) TaxID=747676 RepID=F4S9B5_MELLP|nr:uncharacterized protein MELLADRAFT_69077 [Melampsora larici-populina 98AG31]EGF98790.1 hypothetical protein MELLADRAFT_69077 [Melampsora larici-populina 98AG31]